MEREETIQLIKEIKKYRGLQTSRIHWHYHPIKQTFIIPIEIGSSGPKKELTLFGKIKNFIKSDKFKFYFVSLFPIFNIFTIINHVSRNKRS